MKNVKELNKYLSNCGVLVIKLHNLHWNVEGEQFIPVHKYTEELYDEFFDKFDDVAEFIKIHGESPLVKMTEYVKNATIKEIDSKCFSPKEVLNIVKADLETMMAHAVKIREAADKADQFILVSMMEDHIAGYQKRLWFINATLKA